MSLAVLVHFTEACNTDTTQTQLHEISNTQRTDNNTTDVVIQQHSRKLLMIDILISEACWVHKKWNKIASDIKLVFYSSNCLVKFIASHRILGSCYYWVILWSVHKLGGKIACEIH